MELKNKTFQISSVMDDIRRVVSENSDACKKAKDSISGVNCIFSPKIHHPTHDFLAVKQ